MKKENCIEYLSANPGSGKSYLLVQEAKSVAMDGDTADRKSVV